MQLCNKMENKLFCFIKKQRNVFLGDFIAMIIYHLLI